MPTMVVATVVLS